MPPAAEKVTAFCSTKGMGMTPLAKALAPKKKATKLIERARTKITAGRFCGCGVIARYMKNNRATAANTVPAIGNHEGTDGELLSSGEAWSRSKERAWPGSRRAISRKSRPFVVIPYSDPAIV